MALELDIDVAGSERAGEAGQRFGGVTVFEGESERAFVAASEADETIGKLGEIFESCGGLIARFLDFSFLRVISCA